MTRMPGRNSGSTPLPGRVVIFGVSGYIGGVVANHFMESDDTPVAGYSSRDFDLLDPAQAHSAALTLRADDAVVCSFAITRSVEESWEALLKNAAMVQNLLTAIPSGGVHSIIAFSTVDVYGLPSAELPITESTVTAPDGYYSLSMDLCESLFAISGPAGVPLTVLRLPGTYGRRDGGNSVVSRLIDQIRRSGSIQLAGGGTARRDFLWDRDLGPVVAHFISEPKTTTVNVATGRSISMRDLVQIIGRSLEMSPRVEETPSGPRMGDFEFDISHLRHLMPEFKPTAIEKGIEELVNT